MRSRLVIAGFICAALVLVTAGSLVGATTKDRNLAAALAFWRSKGCQPWAKPDTSMWERGWRFNSLFGNCRAGDGHDQHVYFFDRARFVGSDGLGTSSEILGLWRDDRTFAFMYVLYRPQDPLCCPTGGGAIVRLRWNGSRFRALDQPPPRQNGKVPLGR
jgi:LppP/LprE lipoprotein